jgi:uncharacterized protein (TIGR03000 family)
MTRAATTACLTLGLLTAGPLPAVPPVRVVPHPTSPGYPQPAANIGRPRPINPGWPGPMWPVWYGSIGIPYYDPYRANPESPPAPKQDSFTTDPGPARPAGPATPRVLDLVPAPAPGTARITLEVPADSVVLVQGQPTQQTGPVRVFNTPTLAGPGEYKFTIRWTVGDEKKEETITVPVNAGATPTVRVIQ